MAWSHFITFYSTRWVAQHSTFTWAQPTVTQRCLVQLTVSDVSFVSVKPNTSNHNMFKIVKAKHHIFSNVRKPRYMFLFSLKINNLSYSAVTTILVIGWLWPRKMYVESVLFTVEDAILWQLGCWRCNDVMMNPDCRMLGSKVTFQGEFGDRNTPGLYHMKRKTQTGTIFHRISWGRGIQCPSS